MIPLLLFHCLIFHLFLQENNRAMQVQQEDSEKQKIIDIPSPELLDFKVKVAEFKTFTKVMSYPTKLSVIDPQFFFQFLSGARAERIP